MFGKTTQPRELNLEKEFSTDVGAKYTVGCACAGLSGTRTAMVPL